MNKILITGVAGFIGFFSRKDFKEKNIKVIGIDNLNSYYSKRLKNRRLDILKSKNFLFLKLIYLTKTIKYLKTVNMTV